MDRVFKKLRYGFTAAIAIALWSGTDALADKIGGSNLPPPAPALKGRIADDGGATSVVVVGTAVGATTNAGPTLREQPSMFFDRALGYATVRETPLGRLDASVNLSDRNYTAFDDAYEQAAMIDLTLTRDWQGQQTLLNAAFSSDRDVEERLMEARISFTHAWIEGTIKPYLKAETALLDYRDMPDGFYPFHNQDDRDRISSRAQVGLRLTLTDHIEMEVGGGIDTKHYLERYDDFGVRRDSISLFPAIGLGYSGERGSIRALYMPFWRNYREDLFDDAWKHGYAVEGDLVITDTLKGFVAARYGFEEKDFLIASSAYERIAMGGLTLTLDKATLAFAASKTWRAYDDLDLAGLARADEKLEIALSGEVPLMDSVSLNGRISYLAYQSSFGSVGTDAIAASVGLTYAATE